MRLEPGASVLGGTEQALRVFEQVGKLVDKARRREPAALPAAGLGRVDAVEGHSLRLAHFEPRFASAMAARFCDPITSHDLMNARAFSPSSQWVYSSSPLMNRTPHRTPQWTISRRRVSQSSASSP